MERLNSIAESLISLQELEPSPIDAPDLYKDLPDLPDESLSASPTAGTLGLSGVSNGHGAVYYLTRLQKYSSYTFSLFTTLHLANTSLIPLLTRSLPSSDNLLLLTRPYYQSPLLEPLLILSPLAVHVAAGLGLRIHRRNATLQRYGFSHLSPLARARRGLRIWPGLNWTQASGYVLLAFLGSHAYVNRILPLVHEGGSSGVGLAFSAHGFARHPVLAWGAHIVLLGAAAGHIVWGWARWLGYLAPVDKVRERKRRWTINGVVAALAGLWAAGGLGVVARGGAATGWVGKGFDELYSKIPVLGVYM